MTHWEGVTWEVGGCPDCVLLRYGTVELHLPPEQAAAIGSLLTHFSGGGGA